MARGTAFALLAVVALAAVASVAQAQSIGNFVGGIVGDVIDGVDSRTFFQPNRGCQRRPPKEPRDLRAQPRSSTSVRLTWRARDNSCVDHYEVSVSWITQSRYFFFGFGPAASVERRVSSVDEGRWRRRRAARRHSLFSLPLPALLSVGSSNMILLRASPRSVCVRASSRAVVCLPHQTTTTRNY